MTENIDPTTPDEAKRPGWDPARDPDGYTRDEVRSKDLLLEGLLELALGHEQTAGNAFSLTVTLGGVVVSGMAVARGEWIEAVASQYENAGGNEYLRKLFDRVAEKMDQEESRREDANLPARARRFLHMRDVRIGSDTSWTDLPYWRGDLADVTGWGLGSWNPPSDAGNE